jgi:S1-C subfamily serine protease
MLCEVGKKKEVESLSFLLWIFFMLLASATPLFASPKDVDMSLPQLAEHVLQSTIFIETEYPYGPNSIGSGIVVNCIKNEDGDAIYVDILTNYHVIKGATTVWARGSKWNPRYKEEAQLRDFDKENDMALLTLIDPWFSLPVLKFADKIPLQGEAILTSGAPMGMEQTISNGIVSGIRKIKSEAVLLQITAPLSPGSSGGPVVNIKGEVVGMSTMTLTQGQNMNFAIPSPIMQRFVSVAENKFPLDTFPEVDYQIPLPNKEGFMGYEWGGTKEELDKFFRFPKVPDFLRKNKDDPITRHHIGYFSAFSSGETFDVLCEFYKDRFYGVTFNRSTLNSRTGEEGEELTVSGVRSEVQNLYKELNILLGFKGKEHKIDGKTIYYEWSMKKDFAVSLGYDVPYFDGYSVSFMHASFYMK